MRRLPSLLAAQLPDGGFDLLALAQDEAFSAQTLPATTFATSLILDCLNSIARRPPALQACADRAADFLASQQGRDSSWNYRVRLSDTPSPYPDDLDSTACALAALCRHNPAALTGEALAHVVGLLTGQEVAVGGPYRTWIVSGAAGPAWQNVDLAVNCNVAYFLWLQGVTLPAIERLAETAILDRSYPSAYYPEELAGIYFISRWYRGRLRASLASQILAKRDSEGGWGSPLRTALALSSLLRLGSPGAGLESAAAYVAAVCEHGQARAEPLYIETDLRGRRICAGSAALTEAFCLEASALYTASRSQKKATAAKPQALLAIRNRIAEYPPLLRQGLTAQLSRALATDRSFPISRLPSLLRRSLGPEAIGVTAATATALGSALMYGWMAYSIYDDVLDRTETAELLPVASTALREMVAAFAAALPNDAAFQRQVRITLGRQDEAGMRECASFRRPAHSLSLPIRLGDLPEYGDLSLLADRAAGHALGALGIMYAAGCSHGRILALQRFFHHLIIARQLNDDSHDWEEDLGHGQINAVADILLRRHMVRHRSSSLETALDLPLEELRRLFWHESVLEVGGLITRHLGLAADSLEEAALAEPRFLRSLIAELGRSVASTVRSQRETLDFLTAYERANASRH